jgi:hypothetical protein
MSKEANAKVFTLEKTAWQVESEFKAGDKVKIVSKSVGDALWVGFYEGQIGTVLDVFPIGSLEWTAFAEGNTQVPLIWVAANSVRQGAAFLPTDLELIKAADDT